MIRLTDEQVMAAAAPERLVNIVSAPGSGKTTVAAERFGFLRYQHSDRRGVLGLSFTRAAVSELATRIAGRWGSTCLTFPHRVLTLDTLHTLLLDALLSANLISWPNGHVKLDVKDDYRGYSGHRWLTPSNYRRQAGLNSQREVVSQGRRVTVPGGGIGNKEYHDALLRAGIVSHGDLREVLTQALEVSELRDYVANWLAGSFRHFIIDEVYDAASLDLIVTLIAAEAGLGVTVIGDPRQALYGWRGATPEKVAVLLTSTSDPFAGYEQTESFRFSGKQMPVLARTLRDGKPATIPRISSNDIDVALARQWSDLWKAGDNVLPLAYRNVNNSTDAAINLLLDVFTQAQLGRNSHGREAAITQLRLDRERFIAEQVAVMRPLLADLRNGRDPKDVLDALRGAAMILGAPRRPNRLKESAENARVEELRSLAIRLQQPSLIPGLTVHQAKGGEWPRVGVVFSEHESRLLAAGLRELEGDDCVVYVALTRAKYLCGRLAGDFALDFGDPVAAEP
ncbi:UvrD-helicase domain-containing protein [Rhodococcus maanshanensis]|uniref:DNA helicase-2 / ATP-dependent DNA helicase PcrA n=1 Tax=Rhodococcus maanshanensis TaxID=183556 RepID=A0A1H7PM75_9NOCA|nr:UvrD-helicase domain-containing protein [Rhodococcus maanshanensis]SEL36365.1 DNA helicase-2 / ATP-dependent DNA helicase PcrA [Rhodococcus maanshanensis]